jgi:hypothetical protein
MKKLLETDFVLHDKANDTLVRWSKDDDVVIFGSKEEADGDCRGNESVVRCTELSEYWTNILLTQINK